MNASIPIQVKLDVGNRMSCTVSDSTSRIHIPICPTCFWQQDPQVQLHAEFLGLPCTLCSIFPLQPKEAAILLHRYKVHHWLICKQKWKVAKSLSLMSFLWSVAVLSTWFAVDAKRPFRNMLCITLEILSSYSWVSWMQHLEYFYFITLISFQTFTGDPAQLPPVKAKSMMSVSFLVLSFLGISWHYWIYTFLNCFLGWLCSWKLWAPW